MTDDRGLDIKVANQIFDEVVCEKRHDNGVDLYIQSTGTDLPYFSTSMGFAWEVVHRVLAIKGCDFRLDGLSWRNPQWFAGFGSVQTGHGETTKLNSGYSSISASEAICLAALDLFKDKTNETNN